MQYLQTLRTVSFAFIMSQVLFLGVVLFLHFPVSSAKDIGDFSNFDGFSNFNWVVIIPIAIGLIFLGRFLFQQKIKIAREKKGLTDKLAEHRVACLLRIALTEAPSLFCIASFMLSKQIMFIVVAIAIILYMITLLPTKDSIIQDLNLVYPETEDFG